MCVCVLCVGVRVLCVVRPIGQLANWPTQDAGTFPQQRCRHSSHSFGFLSTAFTLDRTGRLDKKRQQLTAMLHKYGPLQFTEEDLNYERCAAHWVMGGRTVQWQHQMSLPAQPFGSVVSGNSAVHVFAGMVTFRCLQLQEVYLLAFFTPALAFAQCWK